MSAAGQRAVCGRWMPRKRTYCARKPGHQGECRTGCIEMYADLAARYLARERPGQDAAIRVGRSGIEPLASSV